MRGVFVRFPDINPDEIALIIHRANLASELHDEDRLSVQEATDMIINIMRRV